MGDFFAECGTPAGICLIVELVWMLLWIVALMFNHKMLFQAFKLEDHSLAEVLIVKDTVPITTKMLRQSWTNNGQLMLLFLIVAFTEMLFGHMEGALWTTLIYQTGQTLFAVKDFVLNPFGLDDGLTKNPMIWIAILINAALAGVQYYGWTTVS
eukprot:NODE_21372_length_756_cov_10.225755.p1 GENE.NODE_21372_length_756_cov_10.225755~~NODE_21372_length_756_cov_10.225755.p1  ORF type:complete len:154 (+),score=38.81 NODE_21372_length_756_cov_10.225755:104-565(+)